MPMKYNPVTGEMDLTDTTPPPEVATGIVTDNGELETTDNTYIFIGGFTNADNDNGFRVIKDPNNDKRALFELTNRVLVKTTTTDGSESTAVSFPLGNESGVYVVKYGSIVAYNETDELGAGFTFEGCAKTNGTTGSLIGIEQKNDWRDVGMSVNFDIDVSSNDLIVEVTGLAGKTINWEIFFEYSFNGSL